jgi:hypothetical protein
LAYRVGRRIVRATCNTCGWELERRNAQGCAARHAIAHDHEVYVETVQYIIYYRGKEDVKHGTQSGD